MLDLTTTPAAGRRSGSGGDDAQHVEIVVVMRVPVPGGLDGREARAAAAELLGEAIVSIDGAPVACRVLRGSNAGKGGA